MLSRRVFNMEPSMTAVIKSKVAELKKQKIDIISMNVGEADFNTPENIKRAGIKAIEMNKTKYTPTPGIEKLKLAIVEKLSRENNVHYSESEICVTTGAKLAVYNAIFALSDENDEVIIPTPCYVSYVDMVKLADAKPVLVETDKDNGFRLDIDRIECAITEKTKAIIINNPNNPTGAVYDRENLEALGELAVKHGIYIISDEVYENFIYDNKKHISIASINEKVKELTVLINGFSKGYNMTGWRIGYVAAPKPIVKAMSSLQSHMTSNTNTISQWAAIEALEGEQESIKETFKKFEYRRNMIYSKLVDIPGIKCKKPKGAFYLFPDVSYYYGKKYKDYDIKNSYDMTNFLIDYAHVSVIPGDAFKSPNNIRLSYSNSDELLLEGMNRIEKALALLD